MRAGTQDLHRRAERTGVVNDILRGRVSRQAYALLLRNLLPVYEHLEAGLEACRSTAPARGAARRELYRAPSLRSDLRALAGEAWERSLPLLPSGESYARRVAAAAQGDGASLIAHAYTRYFGDLSGGQILKRLLMRTPGLQSHELSFYEFPLIADIAIFKSRYRDAIDEDAAVLTDATHVVAEAAAAFELNIALSEDIHRASVQASKPADVEPV